MNHSIRTRDAVLALEDGSIFRGFSFGANATVLGEAVFNTGMTGYQETLTDPSYFGQIVTMTAPRLGTTASIKRMKNPMVQKLPDSWYET